MSNTTSLIVQHTLSIGKIRDWNTVIRKDGSLTPYHLNNYGNPSSQSGLSYFHSDVLIMTRIADGYFTGAAFNSTGFDRALTTVWYDL